jgi:hypothetical protein
MTSSMIPLKALTSQAKKSICKSFNILNSFIPYGSYYIDIHTNAIGFRIIQMTTDYKILLNDTNCLSESIEEDVSKTIEVTMRNNVQQIIYMVSNSSS